MDNKQVAEDIRAGVACLEEHGWCQGSAIDEVTGALCMYGGILRALKNRGVTVATSRSDEFTNARWALDNALLSRGYKPNGPFGNMLGANWNDQPGRTENEVKKFMLNVADFVEVGIE